MPNVPAMSGIVAAMALTALREVSAEQYERLLTQAKLSRFIAQPPASTLDPAISGADWSNLMSIIYAMLGEDLFRLYGRNFGTRFVAMITQVPQLAKIADGISGFSPEKRFTASLEAALDFQKQQGWHFPVDPHADGYLLTIPQPCLHCSAISGAKKPICTAVEVYWSGLLSYLYGSKIRVEERACGAVGTPACQALIVRPRM
jgi:hypothetical protein